ncbi:MAG: zinc ribbon domain-containing protein [Gemmatimonadota bacterium]
MPYYEYRCTTSGRTVEVRHGMNETPSTWGELTALGVVDAEGTPADTPVERLISAPVPLAGGAGQGDLPSCGTGCACAAQH